MKVRAPLRRFRRSLKIGTKMMMSHVFLALFVVVLAAALTSTLTYQYMRRNRMSELERKAVQIAETAHSNNRDGSWLPSMRTARIYEQLTDARVFFVDADSERIRMSRYSPETGGDTSEELQWVDVIDTIDREFAEEILNGTSISATHRFEFMDEEIMLAGVPVTDDTGAIRGGLILAEPLSQMRSLYRVMGMLTLLVAGCSLLAAALLSLRLSGMLVRPIQKLTRAARRMADGSSAERITSLPNDEIGDLGRVLNSMSGRLIDVIRNLRKERDKLGWVINGIGEGLVAVDANWNLVHVNAAFLEMLELERPKAIKTGESPALTQLRAMIDRCLEGETVADINVQNPSGRALRATASPIADEEEGIVGCVCMLRDVSEAERMEQLRRDYVANVSHELRTPLTGIRGMVEPLIDGCMDTEEERQDSYRVILKETIRLEKLVGEMLDLSRLQDGRLTVELEPMELPGILDAAARSMQGIADEAGVRLSVETDGSALPCMGNEDRITQVLVILMDNALSFTPSGGSVTVFARDAGDHLDVGVRDTGCGIEPKDLPMIWERFYKADKSRMRTTGTGLGLSIAKLVTKMMGGDIDVISEPGQGAEFTFTLQKPPSMLPAPAAVAEPPEEVEDAEEAPIPELRDAPEDIPV